MKKNVLSRKSNLTGFQMSGAGADQSKNGSATLSKANLKTVYKMQRKKYCRYGTSNNKDEEQNSINNNKKTKFYLKSNFLTGSYS